MILYYTTKLLMKIFYDHSQNVRCAVVYHQHSRKLTRATTEVENE